MNVNNNNSILLINYQEDTVTSEYYYRSDFMAGLVKAVLKFMSECFPLYTKYPETSKMKILSRLLTG